MTRRATFLLACCLLPAPALANDAKQVVDSLYGAKIKQVTATPDKADDVALARELLAIARTSNDTPELQSVLCDTAFDLAGRHADGYGTAAEAMQFLGQAQEKKRPVAREKLIDVLNKQFRAGRVEEREGAGESLIDVFTGIGDEKLAQKQWAAAAAEYRRALTLALQRKSPSVESVKAKLDEAGRRDRVEKQLARLEEKLLQDANDWATAEELIKLHVLDFDDPAAAQRYAARAKSEDLKRLLPLAVKPAAELTESDHQALGEWYYRLATEAKPVRRAPLDRSATHLSAFLELHAAADLSRTKTNVMLTEVKAALAKLAPVDQPGKPKAKSGVEVIVEGVIDGQSELMVGEKGFYWIHHAWDRPSGITINGKAWDIQWKRREAPGPMTSEVFPMALGAVHVRVERMGDAGSNRGEIKVAPRGNETVVLLNDHQNGAGGYKVKLILQPPGDELVGAWRRVDGEWTVDLTIARRGKTWTLSTNMKTDAGGAGAYRGGDVRYDKGVLTAKQEWLRKPVASWMSADTLECTLEGENLIMTWRVNGQTGGRDAFKPVTQE